MAAGRRPVCRKPRSWAAACGRRSWQRPSATTRKAWRRRWPQALGSSHGGGECSIIVPVLARAPCLTSAGISTCALVHLAGSDPASDSSARERGPAAFSICRSNRKLGRAHASRAPVGPSCLSKQVCLVGWQALAGRSWQASNAAAGSKVLAQGAWYMFLRQRGPLRCRCLGNRPAWTQGCEISRCTGRIRRHPAHLCPCGARAGGPSALSRS
jgi:hypothetical protein